MKVKWRHPNAECWIDIDNEYPRTNLYLSTPILQTSIADAFKGTADGKMTFCVPIFFGPDLRNPKISHLQLQAYMKRVFWLAYEMWEFTDLVETGTGFYIVIEEPIRPLLEPYRQSCEFPEDRIVVVRDLTSQWHGYMPKIVMLRELCQRTNYQYYMNLDANVHCHAKYRFCGDLQMDWDRNPESILWREEPWAFSEEPILRHSSTVRSDFAAQCLDSASFYREMPRFFGLNTYEQLLERVMYPQIRCPGQCYGIPRSHIVSENFESFLTYIKDKRCLGVDESFMAFYWHRYLSPDQSIYVKNKHIAGHPEEPFRFYRIGKGYPISKEVHDSYINYYKNLSDRMP